MTDRNLFSLDNTDGFTPCQIETLNSAVRFLRCEYDCDGIEDYSIADAISNAFDDDEIFEVIAAAAANSLGIN